MRQRAERSRRRQQQQEEERNSYEAIGATPWIWSKWGSILNSDICNIDADLERMDHTLDHWFALKLIAKGSRAWAIVGLVLKRVFRYRLWEKMGHSSLKNFCKQVLGRSIGYCKQTIRAAEVALELAAGGFALIPSCQSQAIALARYLGDSRNGLSYCPELLREKWQEILSAAETVGSQITTGFIQETLNPDKKRKSDRRVQFDPSTWDLVEEQAAAAGLQPKEWLDRLIRQQEEGNATRDPSPEKVERWQQDMEELIEEEAPPITEQSPPQRTQVVVDSRGEAFNLPTLFDMEKYTDAAPAVPAQLIEDGDFWAQEEPAADRQAQQSKPAADHQAQESEPKRSTKRKRTRRTHHAKLRRQNKQKRFRLVMGGGI